MNHTQSTCTLNWHRSTGHFIRYHSVLRWIQFPHVQEEGLGKGEVGLVLEEAKRLYDQVAIVKMKTLSLSVLPKKLSCVGRCSRNVRECRHACKCVLVLQRT